MPIIKSAKKQMQADKRRYAQNLRVKRDLRNAVKTFQAKPTFETLKEVQSRIDTAVKKNVLKKNTGARQMAQMSRIAKEAGVKIPATKKATAAKSITKTAPKTVAKPVTKKPVAKKPAAKKTIVKK